jgi:GTP-binding protein
VAREVTATGCAPQVFDLFDQLEANEAQVCCCVQLYVLRLLFFWFDCVQSVYPAGDQLDFPIVYASAREGWAAADPTGPKTDVAHLLDVILDKVHRCILVRRCAQQWASPSGVNASSLTCARDCVVLVSQVPPPRVLGDETAPFRFLVSQMDYDQYVGKLLVGRVMSGRVSVGDEVSAMDREGKPLESGKVTRLFVRRGSGAMPLDAAVAGDIVQMAGLETPLPVSFCDGVAWCGAVR